MTALSFDKSLAEAGHWWLDRCVVNPKAWLVVSSQAEVHQSRGQRADLDSELQAAQAMCDAATDSLRRLQQDADAAQVGCPYAQKLARRWKQRNRVRCAGMTRCYWVEQAAVASLEAQLAAQEASFSAKLAAAADKSDHEAERDTEVRCWDLHYSLALAGGSALQPVLRMFAGHKS